MTMESAADLSEYAEYKSRRKTRMTSAFLLVTVGLSCYGFGIYIEGTWDCNTNHHTSLPNGALTPSLCDVIPALQMTVLVQGVIAVIILMGLLRFYPQSQRGISNVLHLQLMIMGLCGFTVPVAFSTIIPPESCDSITAVNIIRVCTHVVCHMICVTFALGIVMFQSMEDMLRLKQLREFTEKARLQTSSELEFRKLP